MRPLGRCSFQFCVPPIEETRKDCTHSPLAAMRLPPDAEGVRSCEVRALPLKLWYACTELYCTVLYCTVLYCTACTAPGGHASSRPTPRGCALLRGACRASTVLVCMYCTGAM